MFPDPLLCAPVGLWILAIKCAPTLCKVVPYQKYTTWSQIHWLQRQTVLVRPSAVITLFSYFHTAQRYAKWLSLFRAGSDAASDVRSGNRVIWPLTEIGIRLYSTGQLISFSFYTSLKTHQFALSLNYQALVNYRSYRCWKAREEKHILWSMQVAEWRVGGYCWDIWKNSRSSITVG